MLLQILGELIFKGKKSLALDKEIKFKNRVEHLRLNSGENEVFIEEYLSD